MQEGQGKAGSPWGQMWIGLSLSADRSCHRACRRQRHTQDRESSVLAAALLHRLPTQMRRGLQSRKKAGQEFVGCMRCGAGPQAALWVLLLGTDQESGCALQNGCAALQASICLQMMRTCAAGPPALPAAAERGRQRLPAGRLCCSTGGALATGGCSCVRLLLGPAHRLGRLQLLGCGAAGAGPGAGGGLPGERRRAAGRLRPAPVRPGCWQSGPPSSWSPFGPGLPRPTARRPVRLPRRAAPRAQSPTPPA